MMVGPSINVKEVDLSENISSLPVNSSPLDRIGIRQMMLYVEKEVSTSLSECIGHINDSVTRNTISSKIDGFLHNIKDRQGIYDFKIVCNETNNTPKDIDNHRFNMDIYLQPQRAVDYIGMNFCINRSGADFSELDDTPTVMCIVPEELFRMD